MADRKRIHHTTGHVDVERVGGQVVNSNSGWHLDGRRIYSIVWSKVTIGVPLVVWSTGAYGKPVSRQFGEITRMESLDG